MARSAWLPMLRVRKWKIFLTVFIHELNTYSSVESDIVDPS